MRNENGKILVRTLLGMLMAMLLSFGAAFMSYAESGPGVYSQEDEIKMVLEKTNEERIANGLPALSWNEKSAPAAELRAEEAAQVFSHTRPDGSDWYTADPDTLYGENLARGYDTAEKAIEAWMKSPGHRENILRPEFKSMSVGYAVTSSGKVVFSQEFSY